MPSTNGAGGAPTSSPTGTATRPTQGYGLGLRVGSAYIARRGQSLVAVPLEQVAAAVDKGWTVEFSHLANGSVAFGNLCLTAETPSSLSGKVELSSCFEPNAMAIFGFADRVQFSPARPASETSFLTSHRYELVPRCSK